MKLTLEQRLDRYIQRYISNTDYYETDTNNYSETFYRKRKNPEIDYYNPLGDSLFYFLDEERKPNPNELILLEIDKYVGAKEIKYSDFYKKACLSRQTFAKLKHKDYKPSKETVICLLLSLEFKKDRFANFLYKFGYSLKKSETFDLIIQFYINNDLHDIDLINESLYKYNERILGDSIKE